MKIPNRFYVGAPSMLSRNEWRRPTLAAAVEHAKRVCAASGQDQIVVQIVRIVRKQPQPVVVERVE